MANLTSKQIIEQSHQAYNQWCDQWREHAQIHKGMGITTTFMEYANIGVGRAILLVANGFSLEEEIETLKEMQHNVDIMVCDKALGHLLNHNITPKYVMVCDANVSYEKYLDPWKDKISEITAFINVCANPKWTKAGFKKICFFVNEDSIQSEIEFAKLSGCKNLIPAATNVSNEMVVLVTQSTNKGRNNWFGYDKIVLLGFDYCWSDQTNYYAFDKTGDGKHNYMRHGYCLDRAFRPVYSSSNLIFSAKWLDDYIRGFALPIVNGSKRTLLGTPPTKDLKAQLQYRYRDQDGMAVRGLTELKMQLHKQLQSIDQRLMAYGQDHLRSFKESV